MKKIPNTLFVLLFTLLSCQVNDKNNIIPPLKKEIQINKTEDKIKTINNLLVNLKTYSTFEKNGKIGLLDQDNKEIIPTIYQEIQSVQNKFIKVKIDDKWLLFESSGKKLSEEKFDDISFFKNKIKNIFMLKNNNKYAIFDEKIKKLTDYIYQEINYSSINSLILKTNDKWCAYDFDGKQIIYPKYDILQEFKNNIFIATLDNKSFLLEANSEKIISNKYKYIYVNTNIFNFILVRNEKDNTFLDGLIDVNGKEILEPKYNSISMLNDNYLILELNNKKSLVDKNLNDVLENKYNNISLFNNEYIIGELDGKETIFDKNLKVVESITYPYPDKEGYFLIKKDGKTGLIHKSGTKVAEPKYDHFSFLTDNFISVNIGGKIEIIGAADFGLKPRSYLNGGLYGVIDTSGKVLIEPIYESLYYSNNYFYANSSNTPIRKNRNILFDKSGKKIMESDFNLSEIYKENYIITEDYHIYGLADLNGNNIIKPIYKSIEEVKNKFLEMSINNLSIVNTEEKNILNLRSKYSSVKKINNEDLLIVSLNNKFGLINMKDEIIIPIEYEGLELDFNGYIDAKINNTNFVFDKNGKGKLYNRISKTSKDGIFITELNNKFGIIDQNNKEILPVIYDEIKSSDDNLFIAKNDGNLFIVKLDDKFGLVNYKGEFLLDINYKILFSLNLENKFVFQKNDKFGVIDINKKIIIEPIYDFISSFYYDLTTFSIDNKFLYLNKNLEVVFTSEYNAFIPYNYNDISYLIAGKDNKFGFIDKKGKVVVPVKYDKVKDIENGYFKVKLDGRWGTVDEKGNENFVDEIYVNENPYSY